ncbi:hypothetical protein Tco_0031071 [Tanacetum coccineum]
MVVDVNVDGAVFVVGEVLWWVYIVVAEVVRFRRVVAKWGLSWWSARVVVVTCGDDNDKFLERIDAELKTLIATYDIPLDLRPRLPDSNFRMSILPAGDTAIATKSLSKSQMFHSELEEFMRKKEQEIKTCLERIDECENKLHKVGQTHQTFHMIMPSKDKLYNGRKDLGFENPCNFIKAKELTPRLYDEKFIGPGYTLMFLQHSNEALEIEKFKKAREHEIEFANDYRNLNATNKFLQPYVRNVILEKIIIYLEDEVVSLLEKEKKHLGINESLKSKSKESCESEHGQLINQSDQEFESKVSQISVSSSKFKTKNLELVKEMRKRMKHYDKEERVFETKIKKLEKVLAQQNKDFKELEEENNDLRMHNKRLFE